jgi:predicted CXXCH cytochrome family protein
MKYCLWKFVAMVVLATCWQVGIRDALAQQHPPAHVKDAVDISNFVGEETCALCHANVSSKFADNPHSKLALTHGGTGITCEGCHGPGKAHVESGGDISKILQISKMKPREVDATCLACHAAAHPNFERSPHAKAQVGCTSCHSIHGAVAALPAAPAAPAANSPSAPATTASASGPSSPPEGAIPGELSASAAAVARKPLLSSRLFHSLAPGADTGSDVQWNTASLEAPGENPNLLRAPQPQLCFQCHSDVRPSFAQPFHHKVEEGLLKCTDCHDAHGTFGNNNIRSTADQNAICTKCHTETRGPFVFEHAAVKAEGCLGCHSPHGSQNARLLNVPNINQMCNQCHSPVAAGTVHGMNAGSAEVTPCISCHTMIHGSNVNPAFIR